MTEIEQTKRMLFSAERLSGDRLHRAETAEARADQQADRAGHFETLYHKQLLVSKAAEARVRELEIINKRTGDMLDGALAMVKTERDAAEARVRELELHIELSDNRRAAIEAATIERLERELTAARNRIADDAETIDQRAARIGELQNALLNKV